jgi:hypothetical protein
MSYLDLAKRARGRHPHDRRDEQAVELWRAGDRFFVVANEIDAATLVNKGIGTRGETWTPSELEMVARISDQGLRDEVERWKRVINGRITEGETKCE